MFKARRIRSSKVGNRPNHWRGAKQRRSPHGETSLRVEPLERRQMLDAGMAGELLEATTGPELEWSSYVVSDDYASNALIGTTALALNDQGSIVLSTSTAWFGPLSVAKYSADGQQEIWHSVFNEANSSNPVQPTNDMAVDINDNVFLISSGGNQGPDQIFLTKLDAQGALQWHWSFDGGRYNYQPLGIAVDDGGVFTYLCGWRQYSLGNKTGPEEVFLMKLQTDLPDNPQVEWLRAYDDGLGNGDATGVALDADGNIILVGTTASADFPVDVFDTALGDAGSSVGRDAYVMKLDPLGENILWSSYVGGSENEGGVWDWVDYHNGKISVAVDTTDDSIVIGGTTSSPGWITSSSEHPWENIDYDVTTNGVADDAFVAKFSANGEGLWATYVGGEQAESARDIAVGQDGSVFLTGTTHSANEDGWISGGFDLTLDGESDAFVVQLSSRRQTRLVQLFGRRQR